LFATSVVCEILIRAKLSRIDEERCCCWVPTIYPALLHSLSSVLSILRPREFISPCSHSSLKRELRLCSETRQLSVPVFWQASKQVFLLPDIFYWSDFSLLGHFQCIINFNSRVAHSALQLGMAKEQLHCPKIFCPPVNQGCLGSPH
jgi:hypothetical protein